MSCRCRPRRANRFANKPHMSTVKAILCNTANQYFFQGVGHDLTRSHQGWGFPSLERLYDNRNNIVVLDEYDALQVGQTRPYFFNVAPGTPELRVTMVYTEPAGNPAASTQTVNNLDLKLTRYIDGVSWWGNVGLNIGNYSVQGGSANQVDNVEAVYLQNPQPGIYFIEVTAASIAQDAKVETPQLDADFALAFHPVGGGFQTSGAMEIDIQSNTPGDLTLVPTNVSTSGWSEGYTALSFSTGRAPGFGNFFGLEVDSLTIGLWSTGAAAGNPFHFTNTSGTFPFASYTFPLPGLVSAFAGLQVDATMILFDSNGDVFEVSNIDRVTLQ